MRLEIELREETLALMEKLFPGSNEDEIASCAGAYTLILENMPSEIASLVAGASMCSLFSTNPEILGRTRVMSMLELIATTIRQFQPIETHPDFNPFNVEIDE